MAQGRKIDPITRKNILKDQIEGWTSKEIAERNGVSYGAVRWILRGDKPNADRNTRTARLEDKLPQPKDPAKLKGPARDALDDIVLFARRYFGALLLPWQLQATEAIVEWYASPEEEFVVVNAPPGSGKSFFFTRILPAWMTVKNRAIRGLIGSASAYVAEKYVLELRREFERVIPLKAESKKLALGTQVDAESTLAKDYGFFKPALSDIWRKDQFVVAQPGDVQVREKEATWTAVGPDSSFIGGRFEFCIWDDMWDPQKIRSIESAQRIKDFYTQVAESRLEPGGLMILQGQRFGADDIYRYALDESVYDDDGEKLQGQSAYHHLKWKAHYVDLCEGTHSRSQAPWPEGCLLAPARLSWKRISKYQGDHPGTFEVLYQQEDTDPEGVLINKLWITGGSDAMSSYQGCIDHERMMCQLPDNLTGEFISVVTADPSPTEYWSIQWWIVRIDDTGNGPEPQQRYLMDMYRGKLTAGGFLDWAQERAQFTGIAQEWQARSQELGRPITHWIVEKNAAQRFLLQYEHVNRWKAKWNVQVVEHETNRNKSDPEFGVWCLQAPYRAGLVRLPGDHGSGSRQAWLQLQYELTTYPAKTTDDCVMANWFLEWWLPHLVNLHASQPTVMWRPSWMVNDRLPVNIGPKVNA